MTGLVLLAAGESARMGTPKQLLQFRGRSLLRGAAETALASGCHPVVVVLGAFAARLGGEVAGLAVRTVINSRWREGIGGSIRAGMTALITGPQGEAVESVIIMLGDQPLGTAAHLRLLADRYEEQRCAAVASAYAGNRGVPALFSRPLFPELLALRGPDGARRVLERHADRTFEVDFPAGAMDVDTPEDYARVSTVHF
jgi:molybdenum cofactor cytidylyltransferase